MRVFPCENCVSVLICRNLRVLKLYSMIVGAFSFSTISIARANRVIYKQKSEDQQHDDANCLAAFASGLTRSKNRSIRNDSVKKLKEKKEGTFGGVQVISRAIPSFCAAARVVRGIFSHAASRVKSRLCRRRHRSGRQHAMAKRDGKM